MTMNRVARSVTIALLMMFSALAGCVQEEVSPVIEELKVELSTESTTEPDSKLVKSTVTGGVEPYTYDWKLDGEPIGDNGEELNLTTLTPRTHTVTLKVTDSTGIVASADVIFTIEQPNRPPTAELILPAAVYVGESFTWTVTASDPDEDPLAITVDLGDGAVGSGETGNHSYTEEGEYTVTAIITDTSGASTTSQATILVTTNLPPTLMVTYEPAGDGQPIVLLDEEFLLYAFGDDPEDETIMYSVNWGDHDGTNPLEEGEGGHSWAEAGEYLVEVTLMDAFGNVVIWNITVEVVEDYEESDLFEYYESNLPDDDEVDDELDEDGDGTVDEVEDAEDESGYDYEADFDEDGDGNPDHDGGAIEGWDIKDDSHIGEVAQSNDTSGGGRDGEGGEEDPLTDVDSHINENETESEIPEDGLTDSEEVIEELFQDTSNETKVVDDEDALKPEYYEEIINHTQAIRWNDTIEKDFDGDGVNESTCYRDAGAVWFDINDDNNPERAVLYRATFCTADRDDDGVDDIHVFEVEGLNATDWNSNGIPEVLEALHIVVITWLNTTDNSTTKDENIWVLGGAIIDWNEDGNAEFSLLVAGNVRSVDIGNDGTIEGTHVEYGLLLAKDKNSDGDLDEALALHHTDIKHDTDGDGNPEWRANWGNIVHVKDQNLDGQVDIFRAAQFGEQSWDNNTDGVKDTKEGAWLGVGMVDRNFDGNFDRVVMANGWEKVVDDDADGVPESHSHLFLASEVKDLNNDGNPEEAWLLYHATESVDIDGDGAWDYQNETAAGAKMYDWNSDGNVGYFAAARVYVQRESQYNNSINGISGWGQEMIGIWILQTWDINSDGNLNMVHAVVLLNVHWDNNSDGAWDTEWSHSQVWHGVDANGDGNTEREVYAAMESAKSDDDADGNIEYLVNEVFVHTKNATVNGHITHEYYLHMKSVEANVSAEGIAQYTNTTVVAYETWNVSAGPNQREETHAVVYNVETIDYERDGIIDEENVNIAEDNRSTS